MPERRGRPAGRREAAGPVFAPLEPVVGVDDERRAVLARPAHPLADQAVDEGVVGVDDAAVARDVRVRSALELRRSVRGEEVADLIRPLQVEREKVRPLAIVEVARDAVRNPRGGEHPGETRDRVTGPAPGALSLREGLRDLGCGDVQEGREIFGRHAAVAAHDLGDARLQRGRERGAREREVLKEDRARAVRHEETVDLLGWMGRPPADDADLAPRGRGHVPHGRYCPRASRDGDLRAGLRVDLLKIEDSMDVGSRAGRRARPEDRRDQREEGLEPRGPALRDEALPVRHLPLGREPVEDLPVEPVEADPDHGRATARRAGHARRAGRDVEILHRRSSRRRFGTDLLPGRAAPEAEKNQSERESRGLLHADRKRSIFRP